MTLLKSILNTKTTIIRSLLFAGALVLMTMPTFAATTTEENLEFTVAGASLWNPDGSGAVLSPFKEDVLNIMDTGVLDSVTGVDLSATTANYEGDPVLICAAGTFASVVVDDFQIGDFFTPPSIEVGTGCYSCPDGYTHNPLLPANVEGVCFQIGRIARARLEGSPELLCPSNQFINAGLTGCYSCPSGYDHNPLLPVNTPGVCTDNTTANWDKNIGCEGSEFPDAFLQGCYSCSPNEDHNPFLPVDTPGVCSDNTTADYAGELGCPSGYTFRLDIASCARCPSGYSYTAFGVCNIDTFPYLETRNASTRDLACDSGEFFAETSCWRCPSGYSHNWAFSVRTPGVCFINDTADYEHAYGCEGDSFDGLNGSCYNCSSGYTHNPLLAISTPGVCFRPDTADRRGDITFVCPLGEFYDPINNRCASCADNYKHNPLLPADVQGVCFESDDIAANFQNDVSLEGCDAGEFFDLVTGSCYSCPAGTEWNPTAGVDDVGSCVGLELVDRNAGDFDLGMELDYDFKYQMGVSGGIIIDEGSVDVDYSATVTVEIAPTATLGRYLITTSQDESATDLTMSSTFPAVDMFYDNYLNNYSTVGVRIYYPKLGPSGWEQGFDEMPLWDTSSGGEHNLGYYMLDTSTEELERQAEETPIVNFHVGVDGLDLDILGFSMTDMVSDGLLPDDLFSFPSIPGGGMFDPPLEITQNMLNDTPYGYPLLELGIGTVDLNTPVREDPVYEGVYTDELQIPTPSLISQKLVAGNRTGIEFGALNSGLKDPDVMRADIDVDGFVALSTGYPVGIRVAVPTPVPLVDYWSLSVSALDMDIGAAFHFAKDIKFEPNLEVVLSFNKSVEIETTPGSGVFETVTSKRIRLGDAHEIIHPGGQLYIETVYSMANNLFTNDTDLMISPILEGEIMTYWLKVLGVPKTWLPKTSMLQLSADLWPEPIKVADISQYGQPDRAEFPLSFADVPGAPLDIVFGPVAECQDGGLSLDSQGQIVANAEDYYVGEQGQPPYTYSLDRDTFSCADLGVHQLVLTVMDENGTDDSCPLSLTIADDIPSCPYTIGGMVSGLAGTGLVLQNNLGDDLNIAADGSFVFAGSLVRDSNYSITVLTDPQSLSQTCVVSNGVGIMPAANVNDVVVSCTTNSFEVIGNLAGLNQDNTIVLQNNGADDLTITSNGEFRFATPVVDGSAYDVTLLSFEIGYGSTTTASTNKGGTDPKLQDIRQSQDCVVSSGSGVLAGANIIDVQVACTTLPFPTIPVLSKPGLLLLTLAILAIFGWQRRSGGIA